MDDEVIGRERSDEVAILEELSGAPSAVGGADRRWLLAIAGMAAIVCLGFAGSFAAPAPTRLGNLDAQKSGQASPSAGIDRLAIAPQPPAISIVRPASGSVVTAGSIPVVLVAAAGSHLHISLTIGAAVLGWRNVDVDDDGRWSGTLSVFAPQVVLPATIRAVGTVDGAPAVAEAVITLGGGPMLYLWTAWVDHAPDGTVLVRYRAAAPLSQTSVDSWVTDRDGRQLGASTDASVVDQWIPGSAGARDLGLGSVSGFIPLSGLVDDALTLHISWEDPLSKASGTLERALDASGATVP